MLVFSTRLPLKNEVTQETCLALFIKWITESEYYPLKSIAYDISSHVDYECTAENITFSIKHYRDEKIELLACRLENRETAVLWFNDCVLLNENGEKSLLIQLNCNRLDYNVELPYIHKPYIVRMFVEGGYCKNDVDIPVFDEPIESDNDYFEICACTMLGTYRNTMPIVYISCDYWGNIVLSASYLAKQLSGVAHVFVEKNHETALRLRDVTDSNNAHSGYIGIYFPGTPLCEKFCIDYYE